MITVNAMGKLCPEPVIMTKSEIEKGAAELEVLVDNDIAVSNVTRLLEGRGFSVELSRNENERKLTAKKTASGATASTSAPREKLLAILVAHDILGGNDKELGEVLMKAFLGCISKLSHKPAVMAFMNEGVKLVLPESSACEYIKELEKAGTKILVCGTCTTHFNITDKIAVGTISNMFEIMEMITGADNTLIF
ncbi:MAG: sulfurtransferase-like selenium metabolism protein YedF [Synergistales bacterium]|nr:sulfurtransferase-like selenium metabolism protein YedF [Synergistales bacterium]MDY6400995.1 sulfurtransferase-like selenium metabolism protein YedF [Synergistales bacterium]MDY6405139.1 sulfurtransferase-like selenium metabolism protein YedF [Synergistales bacterium]MDY6411076.1 sulfurtransferase-like selenium metabolism protein YedF [Synergistales bacterium]MDY6414896.1 sulfurtransferase-like selenium metabolism protein YedF [Synergistales bacterium]